MATILEEIQTRLAEAQKKLSEANAAFAAAQQAQVQANHNFNVWNMALVVEQRDEKMRQDKASEQQLPLPTAVKGETNSMVVPPVAASIIPEHPTDNLETFNKTDTVRNLLRQHPTGLSAVDIWKEVREDFKHRPYLYSVLKRLRDREEIVKRRSKYYLLAAPKTEEVKEQTVVH